MRQIYFLFIGILFGIIMFKSEAASWFRIYEMFQFQSFHMYGIIGSALFFGVIMIQVPTSAKNITTKIGKKPAPMRVNIGPGQAPANPHPNPNRIPPSI